MGILNGSLVEETFKMKLIAIACLFSSVFAEPEADPALVYTNSYVSPYVRTYGAYNPYTYSPYTYGAHMIGKRSADAEPEAKPFVYTNGYGAPYTYGAYRPATYAGVYRPAYTMWG